MESTEELQQQEITALKSIYGDDFQEVPAPKAWKGAARLREFIIKVTHPDDVHGNKCCLSLSVTLPKTYPTKAAPIFTIKNTRGMLLEKINALSRAVQQEAKKNQGSEMVFQIATMAQEWLAENIKLPIEGSLRYQMEKRNIEEEQARLQKQEEEEERRVLDARRLADEFEEQLREDTIRRQRLELEQIQINRRRGLSDATEVPLSALSPSSDTPTESFAHSIEWDGIVFNSVKLFHPRKERLGTVYLAEPVCDDIRTTLPLELYVILFDSEHYVTTQGKKKLKQVEEELKKVIKIRHDNLLSVFAVKLSSAYSEHDYPRLSILMEQRPSLSLHDLLEDCDFLREDRALAYIRQVLTGLSVLHTHDVLHRGISPVCVYLTNPAQAGQPKVAKIGKSGYFTRLLDLYRSNKFGGHLNLHDSKVPEGWLPKEAVDSPLQYSKSRDVHSVGVLFLQMLVGCNVMEIYPSPKLALQSPSLSKLAIHHITNMLNPSKKNGSICQSVLQDMETSVPTPRPQSRMEAIVIPSAPKTPVSKKAFVGSPDDYFAPRFTPQPSSRWREEFEELELLGRGAYGSVVKARHKMDGGIYAVKKIKLQGGKKSADEKILREVSALRLLSHRYIVRYYTTWTEIAATPSRANSDSDSDDSDTDTVDGITSFPNSKSRSSRSWSNNSENLLSIDLNDFGSNPNSNRSFPNVHFGYADATSAEGSSDEEIASEDESHLGVDPIKTPKALTVGSFTPQQKFLSGDSQVTLYIQMEFVERQTLRERIAEGITEEEAWRLFQQIVEALIHISNRGILHRDIKLTNIFIDAKGDCKIGDFGLATSSLAAVHPNDKSPHIGLLEDLTLDVGTKLYMAPEVMARTSRVPPHERFKADMYSLGIVFFEMNYFFNTGAERINVLENLRSLGIFFPDDWDPLRTRQQQIITSLLQHDPVQRPSASELSHSQLLPPLLQDDSFKRSLGMIALRDSSHHETVLNTLFSRTTKPSRALLFYSGMDSPEYTPMFEVVQEKLTAIFRLHGAMNSEPPILTPVLDPEENPEDILLLDKRGQVVSLASDGLVPFTREAKRRNYDRIKRFQFFNAYRPNLVGHPNSRKMALFDMITTDIEHGAAAATAEAIAVVESCFRTFPKLREAHEIHVSHSKIAEAVLGRIDKELHPFIIETLTEPKLSAPQRRTMLLKKGLRKSAVDELEVLDGKDDWVDTIIPKVEKVSPQLAQKIRPFVDEVTQMLEKLELFGIPARQSIIFHPLTLVFNDRITDGVCFEVVRPGKRADVLAAGGRYDRLLNEFHTPDKGKNEPCRAVVLQISVERIAASVLTHHRTSQAIPREPKTFGYWSPRRCDVYVLSFHSGHFNDRLEVAGLLWKSGISADVMYESGLTENEDQMALCDDEGVLFMVYPRPRTTRREQANFKIKSVLNKTEHEVARHELVPWLQERIAEQKRIDAATSGVERSIQDSPIPSATLPSARDVQLLLPGGLKKGKAGPKQIFSDRAFEASVEVERAVRSGLPTLAVDAPQLAFEAMAKNAAWTREDDYEAWKAVLANFPAQQAGYAYQIKDAVIKRREEGCKFLLLFAVRGERVCLLDLS